jgi:hypothetical protein
MGFTARAACLAAVMGMVPAASSVASAQLPPPMATAPTGNGAPSTAPQTTAGPADPNAGGAAGAASAKPVVPATGYGWSTTPRRQPKATRPRVRNVAVRSSLTPDAILPGFETLGDGSTRLFVMLTRPVQYEVRPARGVVTYVLKGAYVDKRNNYNPLVTVHFNTPVTSARLVPHGGDLWFVVELRADVSPQVTMDATKEGGAMLRIELPKGDYLGGAPWPPSASGPAAKPTTPGPAALPATPPSGH